MGRRMMLLVRVDIINRLCVKNKPQVDLSKILNTGINCVANLLSFSFISHIGWIYR